MAPLYGAGIPVYLTRGNHELAQPDSIATWTNFFAELPRNGPDGQKGLTYKVETNNACFIGFDQYAGRSATFDKTKYDNAVNRGMVSPWVFGQIRSTARRWVFVFGHEAAFIGHSTDCLANAPGERDELWDALGERGGVYLCGHDHLYVRCEAPDAKNNPVLELVVGDGGAPSNPYDKAALNGKYDRQVVPTDRFVNAKGEPDGNTGHHAMYFGYALVTVYPDRLEGEWWALTNYDTGNLATSIPPAKARFEKLDSFTWWHH
jgi:DNA repair exonuclease SbcCD nuclease subunit